MTLTHAAQLLGTMPIMQFFSGGEAGTEGENAPHRIKREGQKGEGQGTWAFCRDNAYRETWFPGPDAVPLVYSKRGFEQIT